MLKNPKWVYGDSNILIPARLNFGEFIVQKLWEHRERDCLINAITEDVLKYGEIVQSAMNLAVSLHQLGVRKGQHVAICSENCREFFPSAIGAICAGAVVSTVNIGYTPGELKHVTNITKPSYVFCSRFAYKNYEKTFRELPFIKKIILFGNEKPRANNVILYNDLTLRKNEKDNVIFEEFSPVEVKGDDPVLVLYSSGTTGLPKGVILTHHNLLTTCCLPVSVDPTEKSLVITPWYHVMGLIGNFFYFTTGRTAIYLPKFDIDMYLRCIEKYKIGHLGVVPPILVALCKVDIKYDVSSVKMIYSGAAPLRKDTMDVIKTKFPQAQILQGYGMTEVTLAVTRDLLSLAHLAKPGGVGFICPGTIIKIVDTETGKTLGPNQVGELCVRGPLVMKGYMGRDSKNDFDHEGFFKTGDLGYYDDDRYFFIVDRLKELIKYKAYQVPPAEIEGVLLQHPGIKDAGVVAIEDKTAGEVPLAFVVKQPGFDVQEDDIKKFVAERHPGVKDAGVVAIEDKAAGEVPLAFVVKQPGAAVSTFIPTKILSNPKHLRGGVRFVDEIPKNPSGKILRKNLRALAKRGKSKL